MAGRCKTHVPLDCPVLVFVSQLSLCADTPQVYGSVPPAGSVALCAENCTCAVNAALKRYALCLRRSTCGALYWHWVPAWICPLRGNT